MLRAALPVRPEVVVRSSSGTAPVRAVTRCSQRSSVSAAGWPGAAKSLVAGVAGVLLVLAQPNLQAARAEPAGSAVTPPTEAVEKPKLSTLCKTAACKELIEQAEAIQQAKEEGRPVPDFRPKNEEEKMARRRMRYEREQEQARQSALVRQEFTRNEPAYIAKSNAELFEFRQALADGASTDEAREMAKKAGEVAFANAMAAASSSSVSGVKVEQDAYEQRMQQRREAAAERARLEEAAKAGGAAALAPGAAK